MTKALGKILLTSAAIGLMLAKPAYAAESEDAAIKELQAKIGALSKQIKALKTEQAAQAKPAAPAKPPASTEGVQKEVLPGVKVTFGGYVEAAGIWRARNQTSDASSNWNSNAANTSGIVFDNHPNAHQTEFRGSARQSRFSLLAEGKADKDTNLSAFFETDFMGAAPTANSIETNSFTPRLRHAFAETELKDWGLKIVAGQTWGLAVLNKSGIDTRKTLTTTAIDSANHPGTISYRLPQLRAVKSLYDNKLNVALGAENPQVNFGQITVPTALVNASNPGGTSMSTANFSTDIAPDVVGKIAFDPGFGHYEIFGIMRFFHDQLNAGFKNRYVVAGGGGIGAYLPFLSGKLEAQGSLMGGKGMGRYASDKVPDFAFAPDGAINPLLKYSAVVGLIGHPDPTWDIYTYAGYSKVFRMPETNTLYGYGDYTLDNSGCYVSGGACPAQTSSIWQISPGFWKRLYKGDYGAMQVGAQYSLTRRNAFSDSNGNAPHAFQHVVMTSFRYAPF